MSIKSSNELRILNEASTGLWFDFAHHPELVEGRPWYPPLLRRNPPKHHPALPLRVIHRSHSATALQPWHLAQADKKLLLSEGGAILGLAPTGSQGFGDAAKPALAPVNRNRCLVVIVTARNVKHFFTGQGNITLDNT